MYVVYVVELGRHFAHRADAGAIAPDASYVPDVDVCRISLDGDAVLYVAVRKQAENGVCLHSCR